MDLFTDYLAYTEQTESPRIYHRWSAITAVSALLGKSCYIPFGLRGRVFPNLYVMLIGDPGARKSQPIKLIQSLVEDAGYTTFAPNKSSKEKFLIDLSGAGEVAEQQKMNGKGYDPMTDANLWGDSADTSEPKEVFVVADEFNQFAGPGNLDFYSLLGDLWDYDKPTRPYQERFKNSQSVSVYQPTITILGGNTPENFARAFPPEIMGQGFLSRLLLIHGERTDRRLTFPPPAPESSTKKIIAQLSNIRGQIRTGAAILDEDANLLFDVIYKTWVEIDDIRFKSYATRRQAMHFKLCLIMAAARGSMIIRGETVIEANTILVAAETLMPRALGAFGKAKNSDVANKIMDILKSSNHALDTTALWRQVVGDLDKIENLIELLRGLTQAEKIQYIPKLKGYLPMLKARKPAEHVDWGYLTTEERKDV